MEVNPVAAEVIIPKKKNTDDIINVIHIGLSFLLVFLAFSVAQTFQTSSDHARQGAIALGFLYVSYALSSLFLSSFLTRLLGVKLTLFLSSLTYVAFVAANIRFNVYVMYVISCFVGVGSSLIWTAQGVYVTLSTTQYETVNRLKPSSKRGFFNGLFFCCFQTNTTIGFGVASILFYLNIELWLIFITLTILGAIGSISLLFLRPVQTDHLEQRSIFSSIALLKDPRMLFMAPLLCYTGIEFAYLFGSAPPLILSKSLKFFVYATYGITNAISSIVFGKLSDLAHKRIYFFLFASILHLFAYMLLITIWSPPIDQTQIYIFFIIVNSLAIGDGILIAQIYAVLGTLFYNTPPFDVFANFKLYQAIFIAIGFVYRNYLSFQAQTYLSIGSLLIGLWFLIICHNGFYSIDPPKSNIKIEKDLNEDKNDKETQLMVEIQ